MSEQIYLKTMIETVKYGDYENKDEILGILRNSIIVYDETTNYSKKPGHFWEYIDLRVPIPMLKIAKRLKNSLEEIASLVYMGYNSHEFRGLVIKPKHVELENDENIEHNVIFDEIRDTIIQGIRDAKYTIWIAVAWFTDREILRELILRKKDGLNIRIITSDVKTNQWRMKELEENFDVVKVPEKGRTGSNIMHDKFCIIDFEYIMHGSYNWSKNARENNETWATALDRDFVRKFADEFMELYIENKK